MKHKKHNVGLYIGIAAAVFSFAAIAFLSNINTNTWQAYGGDQEETITDEGTSPSNMHFRDYVNGVESAGQFTCAAAKENAAQNAQQHLQELIARCNDYRNSRPSYPSINVSTGRFSAHLCENGGSTVDGCCYHASFLLTTRGSWPFACVNTSQPSGRNDGQEWQEGDGI